MRHCIVWVFGEGFHRDWGLLGIWPNHCCHVLRLFDDDVVKMPEVAQEGQLPPFTCAHPSPLSLIPFNRIYGDHSHKQPAEPIFGLMMMELSAFHCLSHFFVPLTFYIPFLATLRKYCRWAPGGRVFLTAKCICSSAHDRMGLEGNVTSSPPFKRGSHCRSCWTLLWERQLHNPSSRKLPDSGCHGAFKGFGGSS